MQIWVISGAQRGVGKTHFARSLCAILPNSVYAKLGHHKAKGGKSSNYFTSEQDLLKFVDRQSKRCEHVVLESHTFQHGGKNSINVFIDATPDSPERRLDADKLRRKALIKVTSRLNEDKWRDALSHRVTPPELVESVIDILAEQQRWQTKKSLDVRSKVWLVNSGGELVFGAGVARLLEDVAHLGSLSAAADKSGMSYRHVWGRIKQIERSLGLQLLRRKAGGIGGGGSELTAAAKRVLALFHRLNNNVQRMTDSEFTKLKGIGDGSGW